VTSVRILPENSVRLEKTMAWSRRSKSRWSRLVVD